MHDIIVLLSAAAALVGFLAILGIVGILLATLNK